MAQKDTPTETVAERVASALEGRKFRLNEERAELLQATARIADIDAELAAIDLELAVQEPKRPKKPASAGDGKGKSGQAPVTN